MAAQVIAVDNAREKVDDHGQIEGILSAETITGKLDAGIDQLSDEYSGLRQRLECRKARVAAGCRYRNQLFARRGDDPGTHQISERALPSPSRPCPLGLRQTARLLNAILASEPFQTAAQNPPRPSDITNLLIVATEDALRRAFTDAGWTGAAALNPLSKLETLRALAEDRGYSEAPVSVLLLDGKPPDLVFEKLNNTFARRHHLRIWRRPETVDGKPVWAVAATHDIGIDFSETDQTFIHRIDPEIDLEREKVVNDLLFTGRTTAFGWFDRPVSPAPDKQRNRRQYPNGQSNCSALIGLTVGIINPTGFSMLRQSISFSYLILPLVLSAAPAGVQNRLAHLPLRFETAADGTLVSRQGSFGLTVKSGQTTVTVADRAQHKTASVTTQLKGANRQSRPVGEDPLAAKASYFLGSDPANWRTGATALHARRGARRLSRCRPGIPRRCRRAGV